jgi:hypothetical protein
MQCACHSLVIINIFQMTGLLYHTHYLNEQEKVNNYDLKPQVKIGTSCGHAMLNDIEKWYTEE